MYLPKYLPKLDTYMPKRHAVQYHCRREKKEGSLPVTQAACTHYTPHVQDRPGTSASPRSGAGTPPSRLRTAGPLAPAPARS